MLFLFRMVDQKITYLSTLQNVQWEEMTGDEKLELFDLNFNFDVPEVGANHSLEDPSFIDETSNAGSNSNENEKLKDLHKSTKNKLNDFLGSNNKNPTGDLSEKEYDRVVELSNQVLKRKGALYTWDTLENEQKKRILRLLCGDSTLSVSKNSGCMLMCIKSIFFKKNKKMITFDEAWNYFQRKFSNETNMEWSSPEFECFTFWTHYEHIPHLKVIRRQLSGLCYMHASVVLQHYLVSIHTGRKCTMIDVAKYMVKHMPLDRFSSHVISNKGTESEKFFKEITKLPMDYKPISYTLPSMDSPTRVKSIDFFQLHNHTCHAICELLKQLRLPALVCNFRVHEKFRKPTPEDKVCYTSPTDFTESNEIGGHAMLLVGYRIFKNETYFLLQNWWHNRFFVEVSSSYLSDSGAKIIFFPDLTPFTDIPQEFETTPESDYAETSLDYEEMCCEST